MPAIDSYPLSQEVREFLSQSPVPLLIGDKHLPAHSGKVFPVYDPSSGEVIAQVAEGDKDDINDAVVAAREAFPEWRRVSPVERSNMIWRLSELIERDAEYLAQLDTLNVGLPLKKTRNGEIPVIIGDFRYYAGWPTKIHGQALPISIPGFAAYTVKEPMGVCGAIIPWNFPIEGVAAKLGPALACGNTVVLKPAEEAPLSALWLGKLFLEAGFPPGVVNIVPGFGGTAGAALAAHNDVDKVGFTGSTEVGRRIVEASAGNLKRVSLELGGKSPNVIFADAELDRAIEQASRAIYENAGQNCIAGSRLYVERKVYDQVIEGIAKLARKIRVGPAFNPDTEVGPLISTKQLKRVQSYISQGEQSGGKIYMGGGRPNDVPEGGYYLAPTLFVHVKDDMAIVQEEIFGPVLAASPFDDFDELITRANNTIYGLAAAVWTNDIRRAYLFAKEVNAGIVWINGYGLFDVAAPFGGYKQSGYGRELGEMSLEEYVQIKTVWVGYQGGGA